MPVSACVCVCACVRVCVCVCVCVCVYVWVLVCLCRHKAQRQEREEAMNCTALLVMQWISILSSLLPPSLSLSPLSHKLPRSYSLTHTHSLLCALPSLSIFMWKGCLSLSLSLSLLLSHTRSTFHFLLIPEQVTGHERDGHREKRKRERERREKRDRAREREKGWVKQRGWGKRDSTQQGSFYFCLTRPWQGLWAATAQPWLLTPWKRYSPLSFPLRPSLIPLQLSLSLSILPSSLCSPPSPALPPSTSPTD